MKTGEVCGLIQIEGLCRVCNLQPSNSFNHYGASGVCFSCRNFFKRSAQTKQFKDFRCKTQGNTLCRIDSKTRQSCRNCRFEKCLQAGMRIKWVRDQGGRKETEEPPKHPLAKIGKTPDLQITLEECQLIQKVIETFNTTGCEQYFQFFAQDSASLSSWLTSAYKGQILSFKDFQILTLADLVSFTEIALKAFTIDDTLTLSDRCQLIQGNIHSVIGFIWASVLDFDDTDVFVREMAKFGRENWSAHGVGQLMPVIERFLSEGSAVKHVQGSLYPLIYSSPWAPNLELEQKHYELSKLVNKRVGSALDQGLDLPMMVLVAMILFTSTLDVKNVDVAKIEAVHVNYVLLLQRYLKSKHPKEANKRLADVLMIQHHTKELYDLHSMRLPI